MHSARGTVNKVLLSKLYSLWKLQITLVPDGQPQFLFLSISCLSNSVFLFCSHIQSLVPFLTLDFMLSFLLLFFTLSPAVCQGFYQPLRVHLLHSHLYLCFAVYHLFTVSVSSSQLCSPLSIRNFNLTNTSINHMTAILWSWNQSHMTWRGKHLFIRLNTSVCFNQTCCLFEWVRLH